jgi:hypothetical protein
MSWTNSIALIGAAGIFRHDGLNPACGLPRGELQVDAAAGVQLPGRRNHGALFVAHDAVTPGQGGLGVESGQTGRQTFHGALLVLQALLEGGLEALAEAVKLQTVSGRVRTTAGQAQALGAQVLFGAA